jgi:hypothetical protein
MIGDKLKLELDNKVNAFIKYCQKNSIDKYAIDTYSNDVFANGVTDMYIFKSASNNYAYCSYRYNMNSYIFRFKDVETFLAFYDLYMHSKLVDSEISDSKDVIENNYKFDYEKNEIITIINGHCLKSCTVNICGELPRFYTFDDNTKFKLIDVGIDKYFTIHSNIQAIIKNITCFGKCGGWLAITQIPAELKDLITSQKVIISMIGE